MVKKENMTSSTSEAGNSQINLAFRIFQSAFLTWSAKMTPDTA